MPEESWILSEYFSNPRKVSFYSPSKDDAETLLTTPGLIDWSQPMIFQCLPSDLTDLVESLSKSFSTEGDITDRHPCHAMEVKHGELRSPPPPPGVVVRSMESKEDVDWAISRYTYRHKGSDLFARLVDFQNY